MSRGSENSRSQRGSEHQSSPADPWWGDLEDINEWSDQTHAGERAPGSPMRRIPVSQVRERLRPAMQAVQHRRRGVRVPRFGQLSAHGRRRLIIGGWASIALLGFACSFGVITLNNIVIRRSAELGQLEKQRKDLRSANAMISAEAARLAAPPLVTAKARKQLKMVTPVEMPQFIWQDPRNQTITPQMRRMMERRAARRAARAAARTAQHATVTPASSSLSTTERVQ